MNAEPRSLAVCVRRATSATRLRRVRSRVESADAATRRRDVSSTTGHVGRRAHVVAGDSVTGEAVHIKTPDGRVHASVLAMSLAAHITRRTPSGVLASVVDDEMMCLSSLAHRPAFTPGLSSLLLSVDKPSHNLRLKRRTRAAVSRRSLRIFNVGVESMSRRLVKCAKPPSARCCSRHGQPSAHGQRERTTGSQRMSS